MNTKTRPGNQNQILAENVQKAGVSMQIQDVFEEWVAMAKLQLILKYDTGVMYSLLCMIYGHGKTGMQIIDAILSPFTLRDKGNEENEVFFLLVTSYNVSLSY